MYRSLRNLSQNIPIMGSHCMTWVNASPTLPERRWYHQCAVQSRAGSSAVTKSTTVLSAARSALLVSLHLTT